MQLHRASFPVTTPAPFPAFSEFLAWFYQRHGHIQRCAGPGMPPQTGYGVDIHALGYQ